MTILRYIGKRPVGAVVCSKCDQNKHSGVIFKVENRTKRTTQKTLLCDQCAKKRREWYRKREDKTGLVIIDN